jgi:tyrosine-specific transport protein
MQGKRGGKKDGKRSKGGKRGERLAMLEAIATITGTTVGAGFLGIPYVVSKSGFVVGLIHLVLLAAMIILTNLCLSEVMLRTKGMHQIPGYAKLYLGRAAKAITIFAVLFGIYSALIAYFIGEGQVLSYVFTGSLEHSMLFSFLFFIVFASIVFFGIKALEESETAVMFVVMAFMLAIALVFLPSAKLQNLSYVSKNPVDWFLPYGVILFAFLSFSALPEVRQEVIGKEKVLKKAVVIGTLIPLVLYILFTTAILGFVGKATPEIATIALGKIPSILAIFTMFTASIALGTAIKDMFHLDLKLKKVYAFLLATFLPFILYILIVTFKLSGFVKMLDIGGAVSGGLTGIIIVLMLLKARKTRLKMFARKPEFKLKLPGFIYLLLLLIYLFGIIYVFIF